MRRIANRLVWGFALLLVGVGFLLNALGIASVHNLLAHWWPVIFLIIGLGDLLTGNLFNGAFWCIIGLVVMLFTSGTVNYTGNLWSIIWPLAVALIGLRLILHPIIYRKAKPDDRGFVDSSAVFGGNEKKVESKDFRGSTINAVFGGAKLDLRDAEVAAEGAVIDLSVVFGGVEILVPQRTPIRTHVTTIVGGLTDYRQAGDIDHSLPAIIIRGEIIFGGVEIKE